MQSTRYERYIRSPAWRRRRASFARTHPKVCLCGSRTRVELHHRTYERLEHERDGDLLWLCHECHRLVEAAVRAGVLDRACCGFFRSALERDIFAAGLRAERDAEAQATADRRAQKRADADRRLRARECDALVERGLSRLGY